MSPESVGAGPLKRGNWCQRLGRTKRGRDTPLSSQKLRARAIRRHLLGGLSFLTPATSARPLGPWLSRAFLPEICLPQHCSHGCPGCRRQGEATGEPGPDDVEGVGLHTAQPAQRGFRTGTPNREDTELGPAEWGSLARCDLSVLCRDTRTLYCSKPSSPLPIKTPMLWAPSLPLCSLRLQQALLGSGAAGKRSLRERAFSDTNIIMSSGWQMRIS